MSPNGHANNSLIVDFPPNPRRNCTSNVRSKSVHFSTHVDGLYIKYPTDEEVIKRWYSDHDQSRFREKVAQDTIKWSFKMLHSNSSKTPSMLIHCVGLENFLSRDVSERYKAVMKGRKDHARTVLEEQKRLRRCGDNSTESIALVSMNSSHSARK